MLIGRTFGIFKACIDEHEKQYKKTEWDLDLVQQQQKHEKRGNGKRKDRNGGKGL